MACAARSMAATSSSAAAATGRPACGHGVSPPLLPPLLPSLLARAVMAKLEGPVALLALVSPSPAAAVASAGPPSSPPELRRHRCTCRHVSTAIRALRQQERWWVTPGSWCEGKFGCRGGTAVSGGNRQPLPKRPRLTRPPSRSPPRGACRLLAGSGRQRVASDLSLSSSGHNA